MAEGKKRTIAMTGATGFVGSYLRQQFAARGWTVIPVGRLELALDSAELARCMQGADVVINLAGAPVVHRWTEKYKKAMYDSRVGVTRKLVQAMALLDPLPEVLISTSAIGLYHQEGEHTEDSWRQSDSFLGNLSRDWEEAALEAEELGIRTLLYRFGIVLGKGGGPIKSMLLPFKMGLGGVIGDGSQPFSWIHIDDLSRIYLRGIESTDGGAFNLTSPVPSTNRGLTLALGKALGRPTLLPMPKWALRLGFGDGAEILTGGQRALPKRLLEGGFEFRFTDIDEAVKECVT